MEGTQGRVREDLRLLYIELLRSLELLQDVDR